jgi:hypothetical protein
MSDAQVGYKTLQHLVQRPVHTPAPVFNRWPAMLTHPEHVDAVPDRHETTLITPPGGLQVPYTKFLHTPGSPEKYPPVIVNNDAEVEAAVAKGYTPPAWNEESFVKHATDQTPPAGSVQQYPKWIASHNRVVADAVEEATLLGLPLPKSAEETAVEELRALLAELKARVAATADKRIRNPKEA